MELTKIIRLFDERGDAGGVIASAVGEKIILDLLHDFLGLDEEIRDLGIRPHRDDAIFEASGEDRPTVRDLDRWGIWGGAPMSTEVKCWTSNSIDGVDLRGFSTEDILSYAREQAGGVSAILREPWWDGWTKILLPLKLPGGHEGTAQSAIRRVLAVWRPASATGSPTTVIGDCKTLTPEGWVPTEVVLFSASLAARQALSVSRTVEMPLTRQALKPFAALVAA